MEFDQKLIDDLAAAFRKLIEAVKEFWSKLKESIKQIAYIDEDVKKQYYNKSMWNIPKDTRRPSQVVNNKPKHLVKKIIK